MGSIYKLKRKIIYKNRKGSIESFENVMFGGIRYCLFDSDGNYVKDIQVPFKVSDYL